MEEMRLLLSGHRIWDLQDFSHPSTNQAWRFLAAREDDIWCVQGDMAVDKMERLLEMDGSHSWTMIYESYS
jgi:hypothetical protein